MRFTELLCATDKGIYCPPGDFYIDPVRAVPRALVTHGHSDHARRGHGAVLATPETLRIMAERYGEDFAGSRQEAVLGEAISIGGSRVTFHPAGHGNHHALGYDLLGGSGDRHQAGAALPVDRHTRHAYRKSCPQRGLPSNVETGASLLEGAAHNDIVDFTGFHTGSFDGSADSMRR